MPDAAAARRARNAAAARRRRAKKPDTAPGAASPRVVSWLKTQLAAGPVAAADLEERAEKAGLTIASIDKARAELGIISSRGNNGGGQALQFSLPG